MIDIVSGDLLDAKEKYIAHICNCITQQSAGTAKAIFDRFPYANTYVDRVSPTELGTVEILGNDIDQRFIINIYSMFYPGKPKYPNSTKDGTKAREKLFHKSLMKIAKINNLDSVAFPYGIGCNLAGGNWDYYLGTIKNFAKYVSNAQNAKVVLYKKED